MRRPKTPLAAAIASIVVSASMPLASPAAPAKPAPILEAAMNGDGEQVRSLLKQRVDVKAVAADGTSVLHWIVRRDDVETAKALIAAGADVKRANHFGVTPLSLASENGSAKMIGALLEAGADANGVDRAGETMLMIAARSGSEAAVKALLDGGAAADARDEQFQQTALMFAARANHPAVVKLLIKRGADVNAQTRVGKPPEFRTPGAGGGSHGVGIVRGGWPERGYRNPAPGGMTPLQYAARDGHVEVARILLDAGADKEKAEANEMTPLTMAITNNQMEVAQLLIDREANVNAVDFYGRTPLWCAVETRNMDGTTPQNAIDRAAVLKVIESLLASGANPNARTKEAVPVRRFRTGLGSLEWVDYTGMTPFLFAARSGDVTVMKLLLKHEADPTLATLNGTTPLMAAAGVNWVFFQTYDEGPQQLLEAVKLCVELGNDVNAKNSMGLQAVHGAANRGSDEIIKFLHSKGAQLDQPDNEGRTPYSWAQGVFLATNTPEAKPSTLALLETLTQGKTGDDSKWVKTMSKQQT